MPSKRFASILPRLLSLLAIALASVSASAQNAAPPSDLNAGFVGDWVGHLEYRDYSNNERVFLPTWLKITESGDHRSLDLSYVYDDGPNKTVREQVAFRLDAAAHKATLTDRAQTSKDKATTQRFEVAGLEEFAKTGRGVLQLSGPGMDNDKPVDVRLTITLRRNLYSYRKEIRPAGSTDEASYEFRDGYVFTRAQAPAAP